MPKKQADHNEKSPLTRAEINRGLKKHHAAIVDAVHGVLQQNGLSGLKVDSIRFARVAAFDDQCDPPCQPGFHCAPVSDGSVHWECVAD